MQRIGLSERRLHYFLSVAETGSIRGAADRLDVEPSVVSRQIQQLESDLGVKLLQRHGRGVIPTEAAEFVLNHCRERRSSEALLLTHLCELKGLERGEIKIVAGEGFREELVSWVLQDFCQIYPKLMVTLEFANAVDTVRTLANDQAHIGLAYRPPIDPAVRSVMLRKQPMCVIAWPGHPLTEKEQPLSLSDVCPYPVGMMSNGFGLSNLVTLAQYHDRIQFESNLVTNSIATLKSYVKAQLGVTFLSSHAVANEVAQGTLVALRTRSEVFESAEAHLMVRAGRKLSVAAEQFLAMMKQKAVFENA